MCQEQADGRFWQCSSLMEINHSICFGTGEFRIEASAVLSYSCKAAHTSEALCGTVESNTETSE